MIPKYDPMEILEQLQVNQAMLDGNQKQIVLAVNNWQATVQDHETRLDLNQQTINQILASLQNQQKLIMGMFDMLSQVQAVNNTKGSDQ